MRALLCLSSLPSSPGLFHYIPLLHHSIIHENKALLFINVPPRLLWHTFSFCWFFSRGGKRDGMGAVSFLSQCLSLLFFSHDPVGSSFNPALFSCLPSLLYLCSLLCLVPDRSILNMASPAFILCLLLNFSVFTHQPLKRRQGKMRKEGGDHFYRTGFQTVMEEDGFLKHSHCACIPSLLIYYYYSPFHAFLPAALHAMPCFPVFQFNPMPFLLPACHTMHHACYTLPKTYSLHPVVVVVVTVALV